MLLLFGCSDRDYRVSKARDFIRHWNYERALVELTPFRKTKDAEIHCLLAQCYTGKNNYEEAFGYFKSATQFDTTYIETVNVVYKSLIEKSLKVKDGARAVYFFDQLQSISPRLFFEPAFLFLIGDIYYHEQIYDKAAEVYEKAFALDSTSRTAQDAWTRLIESYEKSNNLQKAIPLVERKYEKTKSSLLLVRLGKYYFQMGSDCFEKQLMDSARIYFEKLIDRNSPQSLIDDAHFFLGEINYAIGNYTGARAAYEMVLRLNPYRKGLLVEQAKKKLAEITEKGDIIR